MLFPHDSARRVRSHRPSGSLQWLLVTLLVLAFSLFIALAMPFYDKFQALLGAVTGVPSIFGWPPLFFLRAREARGLKVPAAERLICTVFIRCALRASSAPSPPISACSTAPSPRPLRPLSVPCPRGACLALR